MHGARLRRRSRLLLPAAWRAGWWAWRSLRRARTGLRDTGINARVLPPPALPLRADIGVRVALRTVGPTCLERSLVLQAWLAANGSDVDIVIGLPRDGAGPLSRSNPAHAWLAIETTPALQLRYTELRRIKAGPPA